MLIKKTFVNGNRSNLITTDQVSNGNGFELITSDQVGTTTARFKDWILIVQQRMPWSLLVMPYL